MAIDYPNRESYEKFNQRKQRGEIPANANIGGDIGIHGTWPHEDFVVDRYKNWTLGCISMKNIDVKELYSFTNSGTKVTIRK
jgi:lipoprotein-anchoring transpeptidase ErfK/SrfK